MTARRTAWVTGLVLLVGLIVVVAHLGEEERFAALLRHSRPAWLLLAILLQAGTYLCDGAVWQRALAVANVRRSLGSLVSLGFAKLFTDQAVPSAGLSGNLLVVHGLARRGVARADATAAIVVGVFAFYGAYALAVGGAVAILWLFGDLSRLVLWFATAFVILAAAVPAATLWVRRHGATRLPTWLRRLPGVTGLLRTLGQAPIAGLRHPRLVLETISLQLAIFVLDAATLGVALHSTGYTAPPAFVFAVFMTASIVATLTPLPAGIGTFDATCVGMLRLAGVPIEESLAATLLFRGFTLFVPLLPGLWLARREMRAARAA